VGGVIHLQVIGGLASRMRCVLAAIQASRRTGKRLVVDWPKAEAAQRPLGTFAVSLEELWAGPYTVVDAGHVMGGAVRTPRNEVPAALGRGGDVQIRADSPYELGEWCDMRLAETFRQSLCATPMLSEEVKRLRDRLPRPAIGAHVRIANLSEERQPNYPWYFSRLDSLPPWPVYLAADSPEAAAAFGARLGGRLVLPERGDRLPVGTYNREGILRVAAELQVLSECDWVLGSRRSTYSELVCLLRGGEKIGPARKANRAAPNVRGGRYEDAAVPADSESLAEVLARYQRDTGRTGHERPGSRCPLG